MDDLAATHADLPARVTRVDITRHGHAMAVPAPGVRGDPTLAALRPHYRLGLVTNGPSRMQRPKIEQFRLGDYLDPLIVSEEVGVAKPDPAIFDPALAGPKSHGGPFRLQLWRRDADDDFARVYAGDGPTWSEALEGWLVVVHEGARLRVADDREGTADSVERLMGTKAEARFAFISDKAEFASEDLLDV
mgnify:CR=1 FL=1